jgi:hypothetical protein
MLKAEWFNSSTEFSQVVFERHISPLVGGDAYQHVFRYNDLFGKFVRLFLKLISDEDKEIHLGVMPM